MMCACGVKLIETEFSCRGCVESGRTEERNRIADAMEKTADNAREVEATNVLMLMGRGAVEKAFRVFAERLREGTV